MFPAKSQNTMTIGFPDVCFTPAPGGGTPIPYPPFARTAVKSQQQGGPTRTKAPAPPKAGGVTMSGRPSWYVWSTDVKMQGKNVVRQLEIVQCRQELDRLNARLQSLTTADPNEWQKVVQDYAVLASALYVTCTSSDE